MRMSWILLLVGMLGMTAGCRKAAPPAPPRPDVLVRVHFAGADAVNATTNGSALKAILAMPETTNLVQQTLDKLARAPFARVASQLGSNTNDCAELLRPLLDDLAQAEVYLEMGALSNQPPEWCLAVRLPAQRAELWRTNLATTLTTWTGIDPTNAAPSSAAGWRLKKHDVPNLIGFAVVGEWAVFGTGQDALPLQDDFVQRIKTLGRPVAAAQEYWVQATVDWPRLAGQPRWLAALRLPKMDLALSASGENLQTKIEMTFPEALNWKPEPWQFPTNTIREPVVSFSAMQGFRDRLKPVLQAMGLDAAMVPSQACSWALAEIPFQTFVAAPVPDASNVMAQLSEKLPPWFNTNSEGKALGVWRAMTNEPAIFWGDMPFFGGFLRQAEAETNISFIYGGLFPNSPKRVSPPPELYFQVLGRTNLAYYDWEIGAARLLAWRNMAQLALMLADKPQMGVETAAMKWLEAVAPKLGNIATAITVTGTNQMTFVRNSPYGFTSIETVLLANWLESVTFPWGFELPAPTKGKRKAPAAEPQPGT